MDVDILWLEERRKILEPKIAELSKIQQELEVINAALDLYYQYRTEKNGKDVKVIFRTNGGGTIRDKILARLHNSLLPLSAKEIIDALKVDFDSKSEKQLRYTIAPVISDLRQEGKIFALNGKGTKSDPYRYLIKS